MLVWHCFSVSHPKAAVEFFAGYFRSSIVIVLPMFFALSGYLVAGSLVRTKLHQFVALRTLRIVPALAFETFLTALLLGPLFTVLPLSQYFSSSEFGAYFLNIVGWIHYTLPGVFNGRQLNAQLWTIPSELECYAVLVAAAAVGLVKRRWLFAALVGVACIGMTVIYTGWLSIDPKLPLSGRVLVFSFLAGAAIFLFSDKIPYSIGWFSASAVGAIALCTFPGTSYVAAIPVAYCTVWLGLTNPPKIPFGDLSYGVYLFHFPVLMTIQELFAKQISAGSLIALALPATAIIAWISWTLIEKPILERKRGVVRFIDGLFQRSGVTPVVKQPTSL